MTVDSPLLERGTSDLHGSTAILANITAAEIVAAMTRSTFGPCGMKKLIINKHKKTKITDQAYAILEELDLKHPVAIMMRDATRSINKFLGDGSGTVLILAAELLTGAKELLRKGTHPTLIIDGYAGVSMDVVELLDAMATNHEATDRSTLLKVVRASLSKSMLELTFASALVDSVLRLAKKVRDHYEFDVKDVKIVKKSGGYVLDSKMYEGVILEQEVVRRDMPKRVEDARIAVVTCPIELRTPQRDKSTVRMSISQPWEMAQAAKSRVTTEESLVEKIVNTGANVVIHQLSMRSISELAQSFLAEKGVMAVRFVRDEDILRVSRATGASIVTDLNLMSPSDLGSARLVEERAVGGTKMVFIECGEKSPAASILVRGGSKLLLDQAEQSILNALSSVRCVIEHPGVLPVGGAVEMEIATRLRKMAPMTKGRKQLMYLAFADALEHVPIALAANSGMNILDSVTILRSGHNSGDMWLGVDPLSRRIRDMRQVGLYEPLYVKSGAIRSAVALANIILQIDRLIIAPDKKGLVRKRYEQHPAVGTPYDLQSRDLSLSPWT
jgi:chaperonin GroEL (HSP60 family)